MAEAALPAPKQRGWFRRYGWLVGIWAGYFLTLLGVLFYKDERLLNDWPLDQAYMIQQFHNWWSGYPKVTVQPGDLRSGFPGEKPFEEKHRKWVYEFYKVCYWLWPRAGTLIMVYAFLVSLSVVTFYLFLSTLGLSREKVLALLACWMLYPLQQKVAVYTFNDPLSEAGTFYFLYLWLLARHPRFAILGCLGLLLPREEVGLLVLPTFLLMPQKWRTLLWHSPIILLYLVFSKVGGGNPLAYASISFNPQYLVNFPLTETILWALALVNARALAIALVFMAGMICVGGEIYFQFPYAFVGPSLIPPGSYYYYGLLLPPLMAALALGIARLKPGHAIRRKICLALLILPGVLYGICQLRFFAGHYDEVRQIRAFAAATVPSDAPVVTDLAFPAAFANRNELYVYRLPPKGFTLPDIFARARFAFIYQADSAAIESGLLAKSPQHWRRALETAHYIVYQAD